MNNPTAGITAVILASGFSKRMGCNKLLLPVEGKAMIAHVFDAVRQVEFEQTVVVTGFDSIAQLAVGNGFQAVDNDSPEIGQSHSVVLGVQKTSQSAGWMFFNWRYALAEIGYHWKIAGICGCSTYCGAKVCSRPGEPVYFPAALKYRITGFDRRPWADGPSYAIIRIESAMCPLTISDRAVDVDTSEGYEKVKGGDWVE